MTIINSDEKVVGVGDAIVFTNKTGSSFTAGMAIMFHEDGEYHVFVHNGHTVVTKEGA